MNTEAVLELARLQGKKDELTERMVAANKTKESLEAEFKEKVNELEIEYTQRIDDMMSDAKVAAEEYKAEVKKAFGIADGETVDVLSTLQAVRKLID